MSNPALDTVTYTRTIWPSRMTDTCVVKRFATNVLNQTTGVYEPTYTNNYSGPCLVRPESSSEAQAGQELLALHGYTVFIPYTEDDQLPGDFVDVVSATDTRLNGLQFVVKNIPVDTYVTVRRLICEDVTSG